MTIHVLKWILAIMLLAGISYDISLYGPGNLNLFVLAIFIILMILDALKIKFGNWLLPLIGSYLLIIAIHIWSVHMIKEDFLLTAVLIFAVLYSTEVYRNRVV